MSADQLTAQPLRKQLTWLVAAMVAAAVAAACTESATNSLTAPSGSRCTVTVANSLEMAPPSGAAATLTITADRDCTWAASSPTSWITITSTSNGQGSGTLSYRVAANTAATPRRGMLEVNTAQVPVAQEPAPCRYSVSPTSSTVPPGGAEVTVSVEAEGVCAWTAASNTPWLRVVAGAEGSGNGTVRLAVSPNAAGTRSGTALIAGQTVTITQSDAAPTCDITLTPETQMVAAGGGSGSVSVSTGDTCSWTASSGASWLTVTSGASGTGPGQVAFTAAANTATAARQGTIAIGPRTFQVTQPPASCTYSISPAGQTVAASGGAVTIAVTANGACAWTASPSV